MVAASSPSSNRAGRVLVIGLDSADAELLERWCEEGYLPTLKAMREQGLWARLETTAEVLHVSAWPSLYTGTRPGRHGMYHAYQIRAGEQRVHRTTAEECAQLPFWKFLDDAGRKCIVMDAFLDYRLEGFRGIQILEYGTWTWFSEPGANPSSMWHEIRRRFGPYPAPEHTRIVGVPESVWFRERLIAGAKVKGDVVSWLLTEQPWDMAFVTFGEAHGAGHYLWHVSDPTYPSHPHDRAAVLEHPVRDVYVAIDKAIGEILRAVDDSTTVLVTSGDGMGPNYAACHLMPEALNRLGLFYSADVGHAGAKKSEVAAKPKRSLASSLRQAIPLSVRHAVTRCFPPGLRHALSMKWANSDIDWSRSRVFCIPNANEGYLRINRRGREPQGLVESGNEYAELVAELSHRLGELVNPGNGRVAAQRIYDVDTVFPGEKRGDLPDMVVTWDVDAKVLSDLVSDRCGLISERAGYQTTPYYTGNHRPNAFVLARGPRIPARETLHASHIVDIAPTVLAMLGVEPPRHMEGRVLETLLGAAPTRLAR